MVVTYGPAFDDAGSHEARTLTEVARAAARLLGQQFGGRYDPAKANGARWYFVPGHTLVGEELAMKTEDEFFGGRVPFGFVANKAIAHPLAGARAPEGWSARFAERVREVVLPGFSAFTLRDAREAALTLLGDGSIRLKPADGVGSRGQVVVDDARDLEGALRDIDMRHGVVIERNLSEVTTFSVGQACVAGRRASYVGTQSLTPDSDGNNAYGGSELIAVRGGYEALARLSLPEALQAAIAQARAFELAALEEYPGIIASRRNYDVAHGRDDNGRPRCGVLEQSWRVGGASAAEIAALQRFGDDPDVPVVHASTVERYGEGVEVPENATVLFKSSELTKYVVVHED